MVSKVNVIAMRFMHPLEFFLNGAELSLNSANLGKLIISEA